MDNKMKKDHLLTRSNSAAVLMPLLWLLIGLISNTEGTALLEQRRTDDQGCRNVACEDDEPGTLNCGYRQLDCIPNVNTDARVLDLHGNLLTNLIERSFSNYRHLQNLDLSMNEITTISPGAFTGLTNLTSLILKLNRLEALSSGAFTGAQRLQTLDLSLNNITLIQAGTFTGLENLRKLYLQGNDIQAIRRGALFGLQNLNILALQNNKIHYISPRSFDGMSKLRSLHLSDNRLTSLPDLSFLLPTLTDIWIAGNPINCDCRVEFLRQGIVVGKGSISLHVSHPILCAKPPALQGIDLRFLKIPLKCIKPTISRINNSVNAFMGQRAVLSCNATGIPEPIVSWTNPAGNQVTARNNERIIQLTDGSLGIAEAREEDSGNYTCHAQNEEGADVARISLIVSKPARRTPGDSVSITEELEKETPCNEEDPSQKCHGHEELEHDPAVICDSTAGIIATALVTFSTTLSTALILFYVWYRRQMEKVRRPRLPSRMRIDKHRGLADGQEACLEVDQVDQEAPSEPRTLQRVINAISGPMYLYAKPTRRHHPVGNANKRAAALRMNKVEDSAPKHGRYISLSLSRDGRTPHGSHDVLGETSDYLPLTTACSSSGSSLSLNRVSCESSDSHLYENAVLLVRDPTYTSLDPATRCGLLKQTDYVAL